MGTILIRYGEIALKGKNRSTFTRQLRHNVRQALRQHDIDCRVYEQGRRLYVETADPAAAIPHLQRVFGIVSVSSVAYAERSLEAIQAEALRLAGRFGLTSTQSFRVEARRADKTFPFTSPEIGRLVGDVVWDATQARVDLSRAADLTIGIEVQRERAVLYGEVLPGPGGMPVPTAGRAVALLSGGIDSPVAAWMIMKRGCGIIPVHFTQDADETRKVLDNLAVLGQYATGWRMEPIIISHAEVMAPVMRRLGERNALRWACVFCKRAMLQKAAEIAEERDAHAIITGDSLGQVASQTLDNMEVISYGIQMPILRPLIGMDKTEITALARRIGTFDISTRSAHDCPYLPANPLTKSSLRELAELLAQF